MGSKTRDPKRSGQVWTRSLRGGLSLAAMARRSRSPASLLVDCSKWRVRPEDYQARMAERDARLAADTRNDCQKFLGDPPPSAFVHVPRDLRRTESFENCRFNW
jgi:hypothetical protein